MKKFARFQDHQKERRKLSVFLLDFAKKNGLKASLDEIGNVLICKSASPGRGNDQVVILQLHVDMVCEKNSETKHNFETDAIKPFVDDDGWVRADSFFPFLFPCSSIS